MNKKFTGFWLLVMTFSLIILGACDSGAGAEAPAAADAALEEPVPDIRTDPAQVRDYLFEMSADVDGLVADMAYDQLKSVWKADFSVDSEGLMHGDGLVTFDAFVFAVDENLCGYSWTEKGQIFFVISGKVLTKGAEVFYPVKILPTQVERYSLSEPQATCDKPSDFLMDTPDQYITLHRDALISTVLTHLHQNVGDQIQLEQDLEQTSGTVDYKIRVSLAPILLD
ncbi:MAG: hypothetical protein MUP11_10855 [Anaerolineales bacterium]|nr:hypothetical protein [Anaerolineales bacterium]